MADPHAYAKLVPGFEFLQGLAQGAGKTLSGMGQWVAPTLDPKELDKRIEELKTVQFWLEQNSRLLATTIQAMEVQKMTLATLQSMNVSMGELKDAFVPGGAKTQAKTQEKASTRKSGSEAGDIDPMKWWSALTEQFGQLAQQSLSAQNPGSPPSSPFWGGLGSGFGAGVGGDSASKGSRPGGRTSAASAPRKRASRKAP